jgi:adenylate kinase family enzyme
MQLEQLLSYPIAGCNVLIIGEPASGKTFLANLLHNDLTHELIHTDDAVTAGYNVPQATYSLFDDIESCYLRNRKTLVEGVLGYWLLLQGEKELAYSPDIVIWVKVSRAKQREIYLKERDPNKIKYLKKFEEQHLAMMNEYYKICENKEKIVFLTFENNWEYATEVKDK